jgi:hypothetical protein
MIGKILESIQDKMSLLAEAACSFADQKKL